MSPGFETNVVTKAAGLTQDSHPEFDDGPGQELPIR
jgi:hypothetical protein